MESLKQELKELTGESKATEADPCWKGYKQVGMKDKDGRQVPNCVPESKASEWNDPSWDKKPLVCPNCNSIDIVPMTLSFDNSVWGSPYNTCNDCGEKFIEGFESKAIEGGRGSGRKGHQKWMLGGEADPIECPNCMVYTEKKDGSCQICGNSY